MGGELAQYATAASLLDRGLDYAWAHDLYGYATWARGVRAALRMESCDWTGALADADAALVLGRGVGAELPLAARGRIQASPPKEGVERVYAPGDIENAKAQSYETEGVPLEQFTLDDLGWVAELLGIEYNLN